MCNIKLEYNYLVVSYRIYFILYNAKKKNVWSDSIIIFLGVGGLKKFYILLRIISMDLYIFSPCMVQIIFGFKMIFVSGGIETGIKECRL